MIRILIANSQPVLVAGLRRVLRDDGFDVVAETTDGAAVLSLVSRLQPEVVLFDVGLSGGVHALDRLHERHPKIKAVVIDGRDAGASIEQALDHGAAGYISKSIEPEELGPAIRRALTSGDPIVCVRRRRPGGVSDAGLTPRELEILRAVSAGATNDEIAKGLWVTVQTVKFHLGNLYRKLGVANRTEAVAWAYSHGLAEPLTKEEDYAAL